MALRTDQTTFDVLKRGFRSGWQQNPAVEVPEVAAMTENEQRLLSQVDDIWHEMNRRANKKQPKAEPVAQGFTAPGPLTPAAPSAPLQAEPVPSEDAGLKVRPSTLDPEPV